MKTKNILKFTCNFRHFKYFRHFKLLIIVLLTFNFQLSTFNCYSQSWQWAKSGGGSATDDGTDICYDSNGNVYMVGWYNAAPSVSSYGTYDTINIPYSGNSQVFLVKYSSTGDVVWAKSIGGNDPSDPAGEQPRKICYDSVSNVIYLTARVYDSLILGNDTLIGGWGWLLSKISLNGDYIWSRKWTNAGWGNTTTDNQGNIYVTGMTSGGTVIDTFNIPQGNFLAKFNSDGDCIAVNSNFSGCGPDGISYKNGSLYIIGNSFNDTVQIDTLTAYFTSIYNPFIGKYDNNLKMKWVTFATSTNMTAPTDICTDSVCNSYVVGKFRTDIDFGDTSFTGYNWGDLFIAKYDSNGVFKWARQGNNTTTAINSPFCKSLNNGDFYVAGPYDGTDLKLGNFNISSVNAYIAKYNSSGNCLNVVTVPGSYYCREIDVFTDNSFSITGYFVGSLNIGSYGVTSHGFGDVYVAKHDMITGEEQRMMNTNNQLIIYANPNAGKCTITIPGEFKNETKLTLQIFDNKGTLLQQAPVEMMQDKISVNITAEAKGVYTAVLSNGIKSYTGKIIFE